MSSSSSSSGSGEKDTPGHYLSDTDTDLSDTEPMEIVTTTNRRETASTFRVTPSPAVATPSTTNAATAATVDPLAALVAQASTAGDGTALSTMASTPAAARASSAAVDKDGLTAEDRAALQRTKQDMSQLQLDALFDKQTQHKFDGIPAYVRPVGLRDNVHLLDYQQDGVRWMLHRETSDEAKFGPFWSQRRLGSHGQNLWWGCTLTNKLRQTRSCDSSGSILADEMGLGKTLQTITLILSNMPDKDTATGVCNLIVAPVSVLASWRIQLERFVEEGVLTVDVYHGPKRAAVLQKVRKGKTNVLLTTYETLASDYKAKEEWEAEEAEAKADGRKSKMKKVSKNEVQDAWTSKKRRGRRKKADDSDSSDSESEFEFDSDSDEEDDHFLPTYATGNKRKKATTKKTAWLSGTHFFRIILDEAHTIRNDNSVRFKAVMQLSAVHKLALTGTPYINKPLDLFALFAFLEAKPLADKSVFMQRIQDPIINCKEIGLSRVRTMMSHLALRRTKMLVEGAIDIPDKTVIVHEVDWEGGGQHKVVHDAVYEKARSIFLGLLEDKDREDKRYLGCWTNLFCLVLRVRQSCCSASLVPEEVFQEAQEFCEKLGQTNGGLESDEGRDLLDKLIKSLGNKNSSDDESPHECAVCFSTFEDETVAILRRCKHVLCSACLEQIDVMSGSAKCPLCRKGFSSRDIIKKSVAEVAAKKPDKKAKAVDEKLVETDSIAPKHKVMLKEIDKMAPDEKCVIFSQFTSHLDIIQSLLEREGHVTTRIDGTMDTDQRVEAIKDFSSDEDGSSRFILCSLMAAGTGITLTRGNVVIMADAWWNFSIEEQAMDRVHRLGQTRPVRVIRLIMKDSLEGRLIRLQDNKTALGNGSLRKLSKKEREMARITALKDLFQVGDITQQWEGHYDDESDNDNGGEDHDATLGGFIVNDDVED